MNTATKAKGLIRAAREGDARWHMGCLFDWKARGEETGRSMCVVEVLARRGVEPPVHFHTREDEAFYVLEGELDFKVGDDVRRIGPGGFVFGPRDVPHGFAIRSETARLLIWAAPAGMESFFDELSEPAAERKLQPEPVPEPDFERMEKLDREMGVTYVGPPLAELLQTGAE